MAAYPKRSNFLPGRRHRGALSGQEVIKFAWIVLAGAGTRNCDIHLNRASGCTPGRTVVFVIATHLVDGRRNSAAVTISGYHKSDNCIDRPFGAALVRVDHSHGLIESELYDLHRSIGRNSDRYRRPILCLDCVLPPVPTDREVLMVVPSTSALAFQLQPAFDTTAPKIGDKHADYLLKFVRLYA